MNISTKTGDDGLTATLLGRRTTKDDFVIETNGYVDAFVVALGFVKLAHEKKSEDFFFVEDLQKKMFSLGSQVISQFDDKIVKVKISKEDLEHLEEIEEKLQSSLDQKVFNWAYTGNSLDECYAEQARVACRALERRMVSYKYRCLPKSKEDIDIVLAYLNRLSDYLWILARSFCNLEKGNEFIQRDS